MNRPIADHPIHDDFKCARERPRFPHKQEWDNKLITEADGYQIPSNWSNQDLDTLLTHLHSSIKTGHANGFECVIIIAGACYLRKPGASPDDRLIYATDFGSVPLELNPYGASSLPILSATDRAFGLFICGFLFKILSKPSHNVNQSWSRAKERYMSFYLGCQTPRDWPKPEIKWLDGLKTQFCLDKRANRTALRLINTLEMMYVDAWKVETCLVRDLFVIPLSYTGMHAYKLFCDVKEKTGLDTASLVSQLGCSMFVKELKTIVSITRNWDLRGPNTNPAFRYARLLGPNYFPEIQTKNCLNFVYCLARILSRFDSSGSNSNPEHIVGLERINGDMKTMMDGIASKFYENCHYVG